MKLTRFLWGLSISLLVSGCANDDFDQLQPNPSAFSSTESTNVQAIKAYIASRHKGTRSNTPELLPYIVDGDTVFYVANYPEGGFEIFTNNQTLPMVFVKSKEGHFNPYGNIIQSPFEEYFKETAKSIATLSDEVQAADATPQWSHFSVMPLSDGDGSGRGEGGGNGDNGDNGGGLDPDPVYVGTGYEYSKSVYTPKGGRLTTKWGQSGNFNQFVPYCTDGSGVHAPVGCGAVAAGQYLFYTHKYYGTPQSMVTNATYSQSTNIYSFSGSSSTIWDQMAKDTDNSFLNSASKMIPTATFLGYLAKEMNTDFATCSSTGKFIDNLNNKTGSSTKFYANRDIINRFFNKSFDIYSFSFDKTIKTLGSGLPVYALCYGKLHKNNNYNWGGHAFLIDYAEEINIYCYDVYSYKEERNDVDIDEEEDEEFSYRDYGMPLSYYQKLYGEISTDFSYRDNEQWVSMNWGWNGDYDDVLINAKLSTWILDRSNDRYEITEMYLLYE